MASDADLFLRDFQLCRVASRWNGRNIFGMTLKTRGSVLNTGRKCTAMGWRTEHIYRLLVTLGAQIRTCLTSARYMRRTLHLMFAVTIFAEPARIRRALCGDLRMKWMFEIGIPVAKDALDRSEFIFVRYVCGIESGMTRGTNELSMGRLSQNVVVYVEWNRLPVPIGGQRTVRVTRQTLLFWLRKKWCCEQGYRKTEENSYSHNFLILSYSMICWIIRQGLCQ
jgi:hypothetical protein